MNNIKLQKSNFLFFLFCLIVFASNGQKAKPQEPQKPYGYAIEQVDFINKEAGISLSGTLTYPKKGKNLPAVVLISGSGPQDRNSEVFGHKPFWVIAHYLSNNGFAVLRFDDRGVGKSTGKFVNATTFDFATDVEAAVSFLSKHKAVNAQKIGLIGHSEGGVVAPIVASTNKDLAFLVLLAGSGIRGDSLLLLQKMLIELKMGVSPENVAASQQIFSDAYKIITAGNVADTALNPTLFQYFKKEFGTVLPDAQIAEIAKQLSSKWFVSFVRLNPVDFLVKVKCPVLILNGSEDLQVPAQENVTAIETALKMGGNDRVTSQILSGLNHLFQKCNTCQINEYGTLSETFNQNVLNIMGTWLQQFK